MVGRRTQGYLALVLGASSAGCSGDVRSVPPDYLDGGDGLADGGAGGAIDATTLGADGSARDAGGGGSDGDAGQGIACGNNGFPIHATPPNVLVLLDRSCSMMQSPTGGAVGAMGTNSKWAVANRVLATLTTMYAAQVRWGLMYFPRVGSAAAGVACTGEPVCGGATSCPEVAPQFGGGPAVLAALTATGVSPFDLCPSGSDQAHITPIAQALTDVGAVTALQDATRNDYVMLVTDGEETCLAGTPAVVAPQLASDVAALLGAQVKTAVVGFGSTGAGGVNSTELDAMGAAGGVPASGMYHYFSANDEPTLLTALSGIVASAISCTFPVQGTPPMYPDMLHVYVNGSTTELPRDPSHASGWDYDPTNPAVTLYGAVCDQAKHLQLTQLNVVEACPGGTVVPPAMCLPAGAACTTDTDCCELAGLECAASTHTCTLINPG